MEKSKATYSKEDIFKEKVTGIDAPFDFYANDMRVCDILTQGKTRKVLETYFKNFVLQTAVRVSA